MFKKVLTIFLLLWGIQIMVIACCPDSKRFFNRITGVQANNYNIQNGQIEDEFIKMLIALVKRTHRNKVTSLPILIHGLEYDEKVRDQNILANGEVRVRGFTNWINKM